MSLLSLSCSVILISYMLALSFSITEGAPSPCGGPTSSKLRHSTKHSESHRQTESSIQAPSQASSTTISPYSLIRQSETMPNSSMAPSTTLAPTSRPQNISQPISGNANQTIQYPYQTPRVARSSRNSKQHYCGNVLKDVLRLVCDGKYFGRQQNATKPSNGSPVNFSLIDLMMVPEPVPIADGAPVASPMDVTSSFVASEMNATPISDHSDASSAVAAKRGRNIRGVVDECCRKPCSIQDLRMYCMVD